MSRIVIKKALKQIKGKLSEQSFDKISDELSKIDEASFDMQEDIDDLERELEELEEDDDSEDDIELLKEDIKILDTQNEYDNMKRKVVIRLFKNLTLEQIENLEGIVKTSFKEKQQHYIEDVV